MSASSQLNMPSIRVMRSEEFATMRAVAVDAFGGDEHVSAMLDALRSSWAWVDELAFVAELDGEIVGQVLYNRAILDAPGRLVDVLVLSPLGVRRDLQGAGIGGRLLTESLATVRRRPEPLVFLEGIPSLYPKFGFVRASGLGFTSPSVRIPDDAFQVFVLPNYEPSMTGALVYPDAFWRTDSVGLRD